MKRCGTWFFVPKIDPRFPTPCLFAYEKLELSEAKSVTLPEEQGLAHTLGCSGWKHSPDAEPTTKGGQRAPVFQPVVQVAHDIVVDVLAVPF